MITRTQVIKELEEILDELKEADIEDANEYAIFKAICDIEDAIEHLEENEE